MSNVPNEQLPSEKRQILAEILAELDPSKPFGPGTFEPIAKVTLSITWQLIWLREVKGVLGVWLRLRGPNEAYPGQLSAPSNAMFPSENFVMVEERICARFYAGQKATTRELVGNYDPRDGRGTFIHLVTLVDFAPEFKGDWATDGAWYPVEHLPSNVVEHHRRFIKDAAEVFRAQRQL
ncbi:MAG: hypothetical protein KBC69_02835 [Candidatus Magasanikbacteria bacterium]|nr:hypothetical protein [Candidatus Magasanikbacteria bacterium]